MIKNLFLHNWQRKSVAILTAIVIWLFVNLSITETKTIPLIPIRVINMPPGKTAIGLSTNGTLGKRITLTLTGTKDVIEKLEPGDLEVQVDASEIYKNEWALHLTKKNLVSLNPLINLSNHINNVAHNEYLIRLSKVITDKIPIDISVKGDAPPGYEFLDIWPQQLMQTVTGPEKEIREIKSEGIDVVINLNDISKEDLDKLQAPQKTLHDDEVSFYVPDSWKIATLPFYKNPQIKEFNDPHADNLRIDFLREEMLTLDRDIPIRMFYPIKYSDTLNPETFPLDIKKDVKEKEHITYLSLPIYARNVSQLFLDLVRDNLEIAVVAAPKEERDRLQWSLQIIDPAKLEDTYAAYWVSHISKDKNIPAAKRNETLFRQRFRTYLEKLALYTSNNQRLSLKCTLDEECVKVKVNT